MFATDIPVRKPIDVFILGIEAKIGNIPMDYFSKFSSSSIAKLGYNASKSTLEVAFHNGGLYHYFDVPQNIWEAFKSAESKGGFFSENIRGQFRYTKIY